MKTVQRIQVKVTDLKPHPKNYRSHPEDQLEHIKASIKQNGIYRNVVTADDFTILAGHGVVQACKALGVEKIEVVRLPFGPDSSQAKKVLIGDNEILRLGEIDDRVLTEILKEIKETDVAGLLGTGYDEMMLVNLAFVTRPESELRNFDAAAEWVGMPAYASGENQVRMIITFASKKDRDAFVKKTGIRIDKKEERNSRGKKHAD